MMNTLDSEDFLMICGYYCQVSNYRGGNITLPCFSKYQRARKDAYGGQCKGSLSDLFILQNIEVTYFISLFLFSLFFRVCLFLFVCIMGTIFIPLVFVSMLFLGCQLMFEKHWRSKNTFVYYTLRVYLPSAHELLVSY